jgi:hypothetical protein
MLVCVYMVARSSIHHSTHLIPSIEFSPTNSLEDEGKLFVHSNPLKQVHIIYISVTKLLMAERLILLHLLGAMEGNIIAIRGHRNIVMCKIADRPPLVSCSEARRMKIVQSLVIHHWSVSQILSWTG